MALTGWPSNLRWGQFRKLDFQPEGHSEHAQIQTQWTAPPGKQLKPKRVKGGYRLTNVNLVLTLVKQGTWVVKGKESDELLKHEQGHWDIAGLIARRYHRKLVALRAPTVQKLTELVRKTEKQFQARANKINDKYENETNHSMNTKQQNKWNKLIKNSMSGKGSLPQ